MRKKKIRINVTEFLDDIRLGLDDDNLIDKYNLSPSLLSKAFDRLVEAGYITDEELMERKGMAIALSTIEFAPPRTAIEELDTETTDPSRTDR